MLQIKWVAYIHTLMQKQKHAILQLKANMKPIVHFINISLQFEIVESIYDVAVDILTYTVDKIRNRINLLFFAT